MSGANEHLTVEEILGLLFAHSQREDEGLQQEPELHLAQCAQCGQIMEEYRTFMSRLYQFGKSGNPGAQGPCPSPAVWAEVATGLTPQDTALKLLAHAAACPACAEELQNALYATGSNEPVPQELQSELATATREWQRRFAATLAAQAGSAPPGRTSRGRSLLFRQWPIAAVAAVLLLAIGLSIFFRQSRVSADALIRQAYSQQRTLEMRLPGAGYGPVQVERADGRSPISSPRPLLEAEVLIKSGLEKSPEDPELLRQKAEADLLTWNYQPAIETLNRALRSRPKSFALLLDLASAYFERAEAGASPADYEAGLQYLSEAIRLQPSNPAALFNRAILYERLYLYDRAIEDWVQLLKIEDDPQWKHEAERRLEQIRSRQQQRGVRLNPETLAPARFQQELDSASAAIEEYVEAAERNILPAIVRSDSTDENYRAAFALAENLRSAHSDPFLRDLLLAIEQRDFPDAARSLSRSSLANHSGRFEQARDAASSAAVLFRKSGNSAGWLASLFEQSYALQFESRATECRRLAASAAADARKLRYAFLEIQLLLEDAICANMNGALGPAKETVQHALALAKRHGYQSLYLRGLNLLAGLESDAGDDLQAWSAVREGLALYWKSSFPPVRAYSFYAVLDLMAERLGHANVQFAALSEAMKFRAENRNHVVEAAAHARLGSAALRLGELDFAEQEYAQAERLFAAEPATESVRWRQLEAHLNLARVQSLRGTDTHEFSASLAQSLPELQRLSNRYLEFLYYDTLADLKIRAGNPDDARHFLRQAIAIAETGAQSLSTWREKLAWMELHRAPFAKMAELLVASGRAKDALEAWQLFRTAGEFIAGSRRDANGLLHNISASQAPALPQSYVLTYAFLPSGLLIWVRHGEEIHAAQVAISDRDVQRTAQNFISECARPGSDLFDLQADARSLYRWLIAPVSSQLPPSGHLIIEPDGPLSALPLEALIDNNESYLGERYTFSIALNLRANETQVRDFSISRDERVLIVAAPAAPDGPPAPPPGAMAEAMHVASHFDHPALLAGREATRVRVSQELERGAIFHFAGHANSNRNGSALLLADGMLAQAGQRSNNHTASGHLDHLQLAVLSACATAQQSEVSASRSLVSDFLQSGARHVTASRWSVDSTATEEFMELFYDALLAGHTPAEALQSAANSFRAMRARSHPFYWAAFASFGSA